MDKVLNVLKKDLRKVLVPLSLVFLALTWYSVTSNVSVMGYDSSSQASCSGFQLMRGLGWGFIMLAAIIIFSAALFLPVLQKYKKAICPIMSIVCLLMGVLIVLFAKGVAVSSSAGADGFDMVDVEVKSTLKLGFYLYMLDYIAVLVMTLIYDFKISKETIKEQGVKGMLNTVTSDVTSAIGSMQEDIKSGELTQGLKENMKAVSQGTACPQCGNQVAVGKKFCAKCGYRFPENTEEASGSADTAKGVAAPAGSGTLSEPKVSAPSWRGKMQAPSKVNGVVCDSCGAVSDYTKKYCAECGTALKQIHRCASCCAVLIEGKAFCAECGTPISYQKKCKECGAVVYDAKPFCSECGAKISYAQTCANCGAEKVAGKNFCPDCGKPYSTTLK